MHPVMSTKWRLLVLKASNSNLNGPIWPKIELIWDFIDILFINKYDQQWSRYSPDKVKYGVFLHSMTSNSKANGPIWQEFELEDDSIKSEGTILRTTFSPLKIYEKMFRRLGASNSKANGQIWPKLNSSSLPASMTKLWSNIKSLSYGQHISHYKSMGAFGCHGNHILIGSALNAYAAFFLPQWCYI